jgi:hypothetical protein
MQFRFYGFLLFCLFAIVPELYGTPKFTAACREYGGTQDNNKFLLSYYIFDIYNAPDFDFSYVSRNRQNDSATYDSASYDAKIAKDETGEEGMRKVIHDALLSSKKINLCKYNDKIIGVEVIK